MESGRTIDIIVLDWLCCHDDRLLPFHLLFKASTVLTNSRIIHSLFYGDEDIADALHINCLQLLKHEYS